MSQAVESGQALSALCDTIRALLAREAYLECEGRIAAAMGRYPARPESAQPDGHPSGTDGGTGRGAMKHFRAACALDPVYLPARRNAERFATLGSRRGRARLTKPIACGKTRRPRPWQARQSRKQADPPLSPEGCVHMAEGPDHPKRADHRQDDLGNRPAAGGDHRVHPAGRTEHRAPAGTRGFWRATC